jgi:hypothetical protein
MNSARFFQRKKWCLAILLLVMLRASGTDEQEKEVGRMAQTEHIKSHCVGRHLIDLPSSFLPSSVTTGIFRAKGVGAGNPAFDLIIRDGGFTRPQFEAERQKRREELKSKGDGTTDLLRGERTLSDDATLFRVQRIDDAYVGEILFLRGTSLVTVRLKSYDNEFLAAEDSLINFAAEIKENDTRMSAARTQGFCLGAVVVTGEYEDEVGNFLFRDGKGNNFGIDINTYTSGGEPLLSRVSGPGSLLSIFHIGHVVLRARERRVAGMHAQEWLAWTNLGRRGNEKTFKFALETMPRTPGKESPSITLSFDTAQSLEDGSPTKTLQSNKEAMRFWDSVVESIRQAETPVRGGLHAESPQGLAQHGSRPSPG